MMDWDLYLRLLAEGASFRYVPEPVGVFRAHDTRVTATERRGFFAAPEPRRRVRA